MGGGGSTAAPQPSDEEKALQRSQAENLQTQTRIIQAQQRTQDLLAPYVYKQAGITPKMDANGQIIGFDEIKDPQADLRNDIETKLLQRSQAALSGNLPVDPALTRSLAEEESSLRQRLQGQLGPGYETSTPGIQALADFSKRKSELLAASSRDDLSLSESLGLARQGSNDATLANLINRISSPGNAQLSLASAFGNAATGFGQAQVPFLQNRQMQLSASAQNAQIASANRNAMIAGGAGLAAAGVGAAVII